MGNAKAKVTANAKENAVKAIYTIAILTTALTLSACGGANPFKFNSDPLGDDYASLKSYDTPAESKVLRPKVGISTTGWPEGKIAYSAFFSFFVEVMDPSSSDSNPPVLNEAEFLPAEGFAGINGAAAVACEPNARSLGDGNWQFKCTFNSKDLTDVDSFLKSEKTLDAVFSLKATSKRSGLSSNEVTATVPVQFVRAGQQTTNGNGA